ncbi:3-dehydroshikimate dehydratase [Xylaria sp. FL1042]|nr:3-dehydroshikimate dehydratase [Xylaria sp. FL1042]
MPLDYQGAKVPTSYATCSIGHNKAEHTLPEKLKAISAAGFDGIELSMPDILSYGKQLRGREPDPTDYDALVEVGKAIRPLTQDLNLKTLMLQPFANFEGWAPGSKEREDAFHRARGWMRVMQAVGTDMLQVGSSDAEGISGDFDELAADLAELADLCAQKGLRVAYENWCWATRAPGWRDVWDIVRRANRPNLGLCLDTFQSAGGEWGDPRTETGLLGGCSDDDDDDDKDGLEGRWRESLRDLAATVPAEKIFLLQISDAYRMDPPLEDRPDENGLRPRGRWSHDYRPLPYDGGYLPVKDFLDAVLGTGFRGWLSVEVFDGRGKDKYDDMGEYSKKAMASLQKLLHG